MLLCLGHHLLNLYQVCSDYASVDHKWRMSHVLLIEVLNLVSFVNVTLVKS